MLDDETGEVYYYKADTEETSWSRPGASEEFTLLIRGEWEQLVDDDTGDTYYVNVHSEETAWELPPDPAELINGVWEAEVDEETGETFYHNVETDETTWDRPPDLIHGVWQEMTDEAGEIYL